MKTFLKFIEDMEREPDTSREVNPASSVLLQNSEGKVLILKRGAAAPWMPNKWGLPGGKIKSGETPEQAAFRETQEEISAIPNNLNMVGKVNYPDCTLYLFKGIIEDEPKLNYEHSSFAFVNKDDVIKYDCVPDLESMIKKYI